MASYNFSAENMNLGFEASLVQSQPNGIEDWMWVNQPVTHVNRSTWNPRQPEHQIPRVPYPLSDVPLPLPTPPFETLDFRGDEFHGIDVGTLVDMDTLLTDFDLMAGQPSQELLPVTEAVLPLTETPPLTPEEPQPESKGARARRALGRPEKRATRKVQRVVRLPGPVASVYSYEVDVWVRADYSPMELAILEPEFLARDHLDPATRARLAKQLGRSEGQIKDWFQNRRRKMLRQQRK